MASRIYRRESVSNWGTPRKKKLPVSGACATTHLAFHKVSNAGLGHDGDCDGLHDLLDHRGIGHAGNATLHANIGGDSLEGHDGSGTGLFSDASLVGSEEKRLATSCQGATDPLATYLLRVDNVHDHASLQHLRKAGLDGEVVAGVAILRSHCE